MYAVCAVRAVCAVADEAAVAVAVPFDLKGEENGRLDRADEAAAAVAVPLDVRVEGTDRLAGEGRVHLQSVLNVACSKLGSLLGLDARGATLSIPEQVVVRSGVA